MKRFIVIVLDGFGIGAMEDAKTERPGDELSNTLGSILSDFPDLKLSNLERLGLMNAFGHESSNMKFSADANYGKSKLMHFGADTFMGHQEIMGTFPTRPNVHPFSQEIDKVYDYLISKGHKVKIKESSGLRYLIVDDYVAVGDNIDADYGMAYNCTAPLDYIPFEKVLEIGRHVRDVVTVSRVIPLGGKQTTMDDILNAEEIRENIYIGIHAVNSKSYNHGYQCMHLGYGVNKEVQAPTILTKAGIPVSLFGKVADIVANDMGKSVSCVNTEEVLDLTIEEIKNMDYGFICTNVQETDLAGHSQNSERYKDLLKISDEKIGTILQLLNDEDIFVVMADHGNDPNIGHNKHTREHVPLLIYKKGIKGVNIGLRNTLSDIGATVCDYFNADPPQNGTSFLSLLK